MQAPIDVLPYVKAAAQLIGLTLDDARAQAVSDHFARTLAIAKVLESAPLAPHDEPAEIYRPAPFPAEDPQ
ncbi:MAG TPA: DUF4089 domain-containing protein [Ramlibacter sp.]|nr:DUF4089 domain-containing protein [Ramlibacter sp.]